MEQVEYHKVSFRTCVLGDMPGKCGELRLKTGHVLREARESKANKILITWPDYLIQGGGDRQDLLEQLTLYLCGGVYWVKINWRLCFQESPSPYSSSLKLARENCESNLVSGVKQWPLLYGDCSWSHVVITKHRGSRRFQIVLVHPPQLPPDCWSC